MEAAQALPTENWKVEVTGLVRNPRTYDLDDLKKKFPLEERVYRFRCVEAWAMVVPWLGFPMKRIIDAVEPTSEARFVRFISYYNRKITKGPGLSLSRHPWPYTEGLRTDEMANDLAFLPSVSTVTNYQSSTVLPSAKSYRGNMGSRVLSLS